MVGQELDAELVGASVVALVLDEGKGVEVGAGVQSFTNDAVEHTHAGHVVQAHGAGVELVEAGALLAFIGAVTGAKLEVPQTLKHREQVCVSLYPAHTGSPN